MADMASNRQTLVSNPNRSQRAYEIKNDLEKTYSFWAQRNIVPFSIISAFLVAYFVILIVVMADAHWACATKANPTYINFNMITWMGLWYRCINYFNNQDQSGNQQTSQTWQCIAIDPTIQILPPIYIYSRIMLCIAIMFSFSTLLSAIMIFPFVKYSYHNKRKLTLYTAIASLISSLLLFSVAMWWVVASYTNGLGWVSSAQKPVEFVQPYVSAWKPAWCCWTAWFVSIFSLGFTGFIFFVWKGMPDFDVEGFIQERIEKEQEKEEFIDEQIRFRDDMVEENVARPYFPPASPRPSTYKSPKYSEKGSKSQGPVDYV